MENKYKAISYYTSSGLRYRIVSIEIGQILDDAQGYGYRTPQKAYAGYAYKTRDKCELLGH